MRGCFENNGGRVELFFYTKKLANLHSPDSSRAITEEALPLATS